MKDKFEAIVHAILGILIAIILVGAALLIARSTERHQMVRLNTKYHDCMDLTHGNMDLCTKRSGIAD